MDANSLLLISEHDLRNGVFTEEELKNIQVRLWNLLGDRTERFTMGDSTSVPVETAQELLKSICFSIGIYLKSSDKNISLLKNENMDILLKLSWIKIEAKIEAGKELLIKAKANALPIENVSFNDTLQEIDIFFKKYDYRFFAHDIPCSIDYQLCHAVPDELQGIEYINEYLRQLVIENEFCRRFDTERIKVLLERYCLDYKELLINIYEPIVTNAIGLALLDADIALLDITDSDRSRLLCLFHTWSKKEAVEVLSQASEKLCCCLQITNAAEKEYLKSTAVNLYARIEALLPTNQLEGIFLSLSYPEETEVSDFQFVDGEMMSDEELRALIYEISSCRYISDKIAMFKQKVHSLGDCIEILNTCFWDDDCIELYKTLDKAELAVIFNFAAQKQKEASDWHSESGWEQQLIKYIRKLSGLTAFG
ncbi:MAG: DUF6179 domain-containing protein [Deltaproteobacteria bacterium]